LSAYTGPRTLVSILRARAAERPDHPFLRFEDTHLTYAQALAAAERTAGALVALGVVPGGRVATMVANSPGAVDIWFGCAVLGVVEVPLNVELKSDLLVDIVQRGGCSHLLVAREFLPVVEPLAARLPPIHVIEDLGDLPTSALPEVHVTPDDTSVVLFTSGTSGASKGVVLNHRANYRLAHAAIDNVGLGEGDVLYTTFPLFHVAARYVSVLVAMIVDGSVVVHRRFSASRFWDICRAEGVTAIHYLGTVPMMIHNQAVRDDDASNPVRVAYGAGMPTAIWESFEDRFGLRVHELYGSTEQGAVAFTNERERRVGTCGRAVPDTEIRIEDAYGDPVPAGVVGEIVVRNKVPGIFFEGYLDMPEATVRAWRDLWFHTGDLGSLDSDGYLSFHGRLKDAIRRRGENVSAVELEQVVDAVEGVHESAAVGVPSELGEEEILVVIELEADTPADPAKVWAHCEQHLPRYAVPRYLRFVPVLPRTSTNRVEKYRLATLLDSDHDRDVTR
jgi:crotonobetaine/carnitine-CoA ligase